jgi:Fic/DOC family protein
VAELKPIRLTASAALKEKRLASLLGERDPGDPLVADAIADAQVLGSLELAGFEFTWEQVTASRRGGTAPEEIEALRKARAAVDPTAPLSVGAFLAWHAATIGHEVGLRSAPRERPGGPPTSPPALIRERLESLAHWVESDSGLELSPAGRGALALARLVEILPFDDANGRVSRLAASHLMIRAGSRLPILVGADRPRLVQCLQAAFQLSTEPLVVLLDEASERALDVAIQALTTADRG